MSAKTKQLKATSLKYAERINKSADQIQEELVETSIAEAKKQLELGTLEVKGKMIKAEAEIKSVKVKIAVAERQLESAKGAMPFDVNSILRARTTIKQTELELEEKQEVFNQTKSAYDYLVDLNTELF